VGGVGGHVRGVVEAHAQGPEVFAVEVEALGEGGEGDDDAVVDVAAAAGDAAVGQAADDLEGDVLDEDDLAHGRGLAEEEPGRVVADERDLGRVLHVLDA